jgi:hypothetical protein
MTMKFYPINKSVLEAFVFSNALMFRTQTGKNVIGYYEWRQGRNTDWVVSGNSEHPLSEFVEVAICPPKSEWLVDKLRYVVEDHALQHNGVMTVSATVCVNGGEQVFNLI